MGFFEIFAGGLREDGRCEGAEDFAVLDAAIQNFFHFRAARIGDDAAIAEGARSPFGAALKPAENFPVGDDLRGAAHEVGLGEFRDGITVMRDSAERRWRGAFRRVNSPVPSRHDS